MRTSEVPVDVQDKEKDTELSSLNVKEVILDGGDPTRVEARQRWTSGEKIMILFAYSFVATAGPVCTTIYLPALKEIQREFSCSDLELNLTMTMYALALAFFPLLWGQMSDYVGRAWIVRFCLCLFCVSCVLCAIAWSIWALIVFRVLMAISTAAENSIGAGVVGDLFTTKHRGTAMGIFSTTTVCGPLVGPIIGGILTELWGWRSIFWILGGVGVVMVFIMFTIGAETHPRRVLSRTHNVPSIRYPMMMVNAGLWMNDHSPWGSKSAISWLRTKVKALNAAADENDSQSDERDVMEMQEINEETEMSSTASEGPREISSCSDSGLELLPKSPILDDTENDFEIAIDKLARSYPGSSAVGALADSARESDARSFPELDNVGEKRKRETVGLFFSVISNPILIVFVLSQGLSFGVVYVMMVYFPIVLDEEYGASPSQIGLYMLPEGIAAVFAMFIGGRVADGCFKFLGRNGHMLPYIVSQVALFFFLVFLAWSYQVSLVLLIILTVPLGVSFNVGRPGLFAYLMGENPPMSSTIIGLTFCSMFVFGAIETAVAAPIENIFGLEWMFTITGAVAIIALAPLVWVYIRRRTQSIQEAAAAAEI